MPAEEPVNPVDVENNIRRLANEVARSVRIVSDALRSYNDAHRAFDAAYARAFATARGSVQAKKYAADELTMMERAAMDDADALHQYAKSRARALELELSAWQTLARSVIAMYGVAGA